MSRAPLTDDVDEFIKVRPECFVVPFKDILFNDNYQIPDIDFNLNKLQQSVNSTRAKFVAGDCVKIRGQKNLAEPPYIPLISEVGNCFILDMAGGKALHADIDNKVDKNVDILLQILNDKKEHALLLKKGVTESDLLTSLNVGSSKVTKVAEKLLTKDKVQSNKKRTQKTTKSSKKKRKVLDEEDDYLESE